MQEESASPLARGLVMPEWMLGVHRIVPREIVQQRIASVAEDTQGILKSMAFCMHILIRTKQLRLKS